MTLRTRKSRLNQTGLTDHEAALCRTVELPQRYWFVKEPKGVNFAGIVLPDKTSYKVSYQQEIYEKLLKLDLKGNTYPWRALATAGAASSTYAMEIVSYIVKSALFRQPSQVDKVLFIDGQFSDRYRDMDVRSHKLVVVYNISEENDDKTTLMYNRGLWWALRVPMIFVVACKNPFDFVTRRFHSDPEMLLHFRDLNQAKVIKALHNGTQRKTDKVIVV